MATTKISGPFTQADGIVEAKTASYHDPVTQVSVATDSTTGTLAVKAKYNQYSDAELVYEEDGTTPLVIDLASLKSFQLFDKWVWCLEFEPTDVDASYTITVASGEMYTRFS